MKLPWNKKYLEISFHVLLTLAALYALYLAGSLAVHVLANFGDIWKGISKIFGYLFSVFAIAIIAFAVAYVLDPVVDYFQRSFVGFNQRKIIPFRKKHKLFIVIKRKKSGKPEKKGVITGTESRFETRTAGTAITFSVIIGAVAILVFAIAMKLNHGGGDMSTSAAESLNGMVDDYMEFYARISVQLEAWGVTEAVQGAITRMTDGLANALQGISNELVGNIAKMGTYAANFFAGVFLSFYFLRDKAKILFLVKKTTWAFLPTDFGRTARLVLGEVNGIFTKYIRGQLTAAAIMSVLFSVVLSIIGVNFPIIIGIFSGIANIIPYFGSVIAFSLTMVVALMSGNPMQALYAAIAILAIQQFDGMYISPKVVGQNVELSPAVVLVAITVGGNLFGIVGMIFAVPVCALLKLFMGRYTLYKIEKKEKAVAVD